MKKLKELFTHSRFGLGAAIGVTVGYVMDADLNGIFAGVLAGTLIIIVVENMISRK